MVSELLICELVRRNIVRVDTEIEAVYHTRGLDGTQTVRSVGIFTISRIEPRADGYVFEARDLQLGRVLRIPSSHVRRIDGMDGERIGQTYGLSDIGLPLKLGRRRGRKPRGAPPQPSQA